MRLALIILLASVSHGGVAVASSGRALRGAASWARSLQELEADELSDPGGLVDRPSEVEFVPPVEQEAEIEHTASAPEEAAANPGAAERREAPRRNQAALQAAEAAVTNAAEAVEEMGTISKMMHSTLPAETEAQAAQTQAAGEMDDLREAVERQEGEEVVQRLATAVQHSAAHVVKAASAAVEAVEGAVTPRKPSTPMEELVARKAAQMHAQRVVAESIIPPPRAVPPAPGKAVVEVEREDDEDKMPLTRMVEAQFGRAYVANLTKQMAVIDREEEEEEREKENTRRAKANQFNEALLAHRAARSNYAAQRDAEAQDPDTVKVMSMADFDFRDPEKLKRSTAIEETEAELKAELPWKRVVAEEYFPDGDMNLTKRVAAFKERYVEPGSTGAALLKSAGYYNKEAFGFAPRDEKAGDIPVELEQVPLPNDWLKGAPSPPPATPLPPANMQTEHVVLLLWRDEHYDRDDDDEFNHMMTWYVNQQSKCRSTCHLTDDKSLLGVGAAHAVLFSHSQMEKDTCGGKCLPPTHNVPWVYVNSMTPNATRDLEWLPADWTATWDWHSDVPATRGLNNVGFWPRHPTTVSSFYKQAAEAHSSKSNLAVFAMDRCFPKDRIQWGRSLGGYLQAKILGACHASYTDPRSTALQAEAFNLSKYNYHQLKHAPGFRRFGSRVAAHVKEGKDVTGVNELYLDKPVDDYEKAIAMRNSKFCIIVEYDITTPHYMSEQLNQALLAGCVPVYMGSDQVLEVMPPKSIINARDWHRVQDLGNFLRHMTNTEWRTYHEWRTNPSMRGNLTAWLESNTQSLGCRLCDRVREHWAQAEDGWNSPLFQPKKVVPIIVKPETELSKVHAAQNEQLLLSIKQKYRAAELHNTSQASITSTYDHHTHEFTSEEELNKVAHNLTAALERQNRHYEGLQALRKRGVVMHQGEERPEVTGTQLTLQDPHLLEPEHIEQLHDAVSRVDALRLRNFQRQAITAGLIKAPPTDTARGEMVRSHFPRLRRGKQPRPLGTYTMVEDLPQLHV